MTQLIPQDRVSDRVDEQIIDCPVPQILGAKCGIVESRRSTAWATAHRGSKPQEQKLVEVIQLCKDESPNASWSTPSPFVTRGFRTGLPIGLAQHKVPAQGRDQEEQCEVRGNVR